MTRRWNILCFSAVVGVGFLFSELDAGAEDEAVGFVSVEIATVGIDPLTGIPVLLLRELNGGGRFLVMSIGPHEAQSIGRAMFQLEMPRPMTHDLMQSLLLAADFELDRVVVDDFRDSTYFATIHGRRGKDGEEVRVDSRPSDAIALAVRTMTPIQVADRLLEGLAAPPEPQIDPGQLFHVSGLTVVAAAEEELRAAGLPDGVGALRVVALHDALREGFRIGDLVLEADGEKLSQPGDLMRVLRQKRGAESIRLLIRRGNDQIEAELPVSPAPRRGPAPGESPITA